MQWSQKSFYIALALICRKMVQFVNSSSTSFSLFKFPATDKCSFICWFVSTRWKNYTKVYMNKWRRLWKINPFKPFDKSIIPKILRKEYSSRKKKVICIVVFKSLCLLWLKSFIIERWNFVFLSTWCFPIQFQTVLMWWINKLSLVEYV